MKLKSLHLTNTNINFDGRILKEMSSLTKSGMPLDLYGYGISLPEDKNRKKECGIDNIVTVKLLTSTLRFLPRGALYFFMLIEFTFRACIFGLRKRPDIVHCHDTFSLPAGALLSFFGSKLIYDAHELESNKNGQSKLLSKVTLLLEKLCWGRISGFVTVSNRILEWYQSHFSIVESAVVLNAPIKCPPSLSKKNEQAYLRRLFSIPSETLLFVYVGILAPGRGIEKILEVFQENESSALVFLGYGPLSDDIEQLAGQFKNIYLHPAVSHDKVVETIAGSDYGFCLINDSSLSDYYSLPNKLFEYASAGLKVIGSNYPEIQSTLANHKLGFVVDDNVEAISSTVKKLEKERPGFAPEKIEELTWERQEQKLIDFYQRVVGL